MDGKIKPWQIALFVVAVIAVAASSLLSLGGNTPPIRNERFAVDVVTGQLYRFNTSKVAALFPETNPETNQRTIVPVTKGDDGKWRAQARFLAGLDAGIKPTAIVGKDGEWRDVNITSENAKEIRKQK